ncbi:hypothetical protein ACSBOB_20140 [Mesorhizobium sp. ASY16-5R]|uniref:hypothetical protein n=1 Tax=Mesorhizobium sp. ASY16-5R TaxID=3445772 RepID=UPI003FA12BD9
MTVRNVQRLTRKLVGIPEGARRRIEGALLASAAEMNSFAIVKIQKGSGTGRTYKRGQRSHTASAPGEYPNSDYGELVRKMFFEMRGRLTAVWGNSAKHARPLELGTSRMAARPFLRPTYLALRERAKKRVGDAVREALKAYARGR